MQFLARPIEHEHAARAVSRAGGELRLQAADRLARAMINLERADQPPRVVRMQPRRSRRIDRRQSGMQCAPILPAGQSLPIRRENPNRPAGRRTSLATCAFRYSGDPPTNSGRRPRSRICWTACLRRIDILGNAEILGRLEQIEQMMRHGLPLGRRRFGRADIEPAIDGHRIQRQNLAADPPRQFDRDRRLAGSRRAGEKPTFVEVERASCDYSRDSFDVPAGDCPESRSRGENWRIVGDYPTLPRLKLLLKISTRFQTAASPDYLRSLFCLPRRCMNESQPHGLAHLMATIEDRKANPPAKSYTTTLFAGGVPKIGEKITEEAAEVVEAAGEPDEAGRTHLIREAADLIYHLFVMLAHRGVRLSEVEAELARRSGISGLDEKASRSKPQ